MTGWTKTLEKLDIKNDLTRPTLDLLLDASLPRLRHLQLLGNCDGGTALVFGQGSLTEESAQWKQLETLHIRYIDTKDIPNWIASLTALKEFSIEFCPNLKEFPKWFSKLTALQKLSLRNIYCLSELPQVLSQLHGLKQLCE